MARSNVFDASPYLRPPKLDVRQAVALAIALLAALPRDATKGMKRTARVMRRSTLVLKQAWAARRRAEGKASPSDKSKVDNRVDTSWGALKMRVDAYGLLPDDRAPLAQRAREISATLFPEGLGFLTLPMEEEWAESNQRIERIDHEGLAAELDTIAGPEFLAEIRVAHIVYGEVLGITKPPPVPPDVGALLDPLRSVVAAIGDYLLQVVASVDREEPETIQEARAALLPIDRFREGVARRASGKGGKRDEQEEESEDDLPEIDPDAPVPEVPQ
jgi:hypothetical protein